MNLRCQDVDDLLPAFAVDALEPDERLAVLEHLAECRLHDAELADYRDVLGSLPDAVPAQAAPARVRNSLLSEFDRLVQSGDAEAVGARPPARRGGLSILKRSGFAYGLAAALVLVVLGLAAWNLSLQDGDDAQVVEVSSRQGNVSLNVRYLPEYNVALFEVDAPALPAGRVYQAWKIEGAQPVSLGLLSTNRGLTAFLADLQNAAAVALSDEPAGGSVAPTTTPLIALEF